MVLTAALLAVLGTAGATEAPPPLSATMAQQYRMSTEDEDSFRSGVSMARFGQGMFTLASAASLAGTLIYYVGQEDEQWRNIGWYTMLAGTGVGLIAVPVTVVGSQRATMAVARAGRSVSRHSGNLSMVFLGLSAGTLAGAAVLRNSDPIVGELGMYVGWLLASTSFEMAVHQLGQAEWAHNRPILFGAMPLGNGLAVVGRF